MRTGLWPLPPPKTTGKGDASGSSGGGAAPDPYAAIVNMREQLWAEDVALANNDPVANWPARTGLALAQAVAGNQPTYKTSVAHLNNRAAVHMPLDDFMSSASLAHGIAAGAFYFMAVFSADAIAAAYSALACLGSFAPAFYKSSNNVNYYQGGDGMPSAGFTIVANTKYIWEVIRDGAGSLQHYKNGVALGIPLARAGSIANAAFHVGNDNGGSYFQGHVARILLAASDPRGPIRDAVIADVKAYYGIA